ncbi:uncharacterized protein LOC113005485 isoform X2 [Solenopsis invicta]|nr:uncharacterized protein LOC113005485 isoform X2 [Solenopsis invicta]
MEIATPSMSTMNTESAAQCEVITQTPNTSKESMDDIASTNNYVDMEIATPSMSTMNTETAAQCEVITQTPKKNN